MQRRRTRSSAIVALAVFLAMASGASATAWAAIELEPHEPVVGQAVTITLSEPAAELEVTYRPNSSVIETDVLRAESPVTTFTWTPDHAGIVSLKAGEDKKSVSVRFDSFPVLGFLTLLVAGSILFGGAGFAFRVLFRSGNKEGDLGYDPSPLHHPDT